MPFILPTKERRCEDRISDYGQCRIAVDGRLATLLDVSTRGARFQAEYRPPAGSAIVVQLPHSMPAHATVLASEPNVRIAFVDPIDPDVYAT